MRTFEEGEIAEVSGGIRGKEQDPVCSCMYCSSLNPAPHWDVLSPPKAPLQGTLMFFGSRWFWVTATVIKAITAKTKRKPRMSTAIFGLVEAIFGLAPVTTAKKSVLGTTESPGHCSQRCWSS